MHYQYNGFFLLFLQLKKGKIMKYQRTEHNFLAIDEKYSNFEDSAIAILPVPYEETVSWRGGTSKGPEAIIAASQYVEFYDDEFDRELCFEKGITTLKPVELDGARDYDAIDLIEKAASEVLKNSKFCVALGGEHSISSALIRAHFNKYPEMSVLQFDAHSDLRDEYEGNKYSHASVMARVAEFMSPDRITQVGIRAQCKDEAEFIRQWGVQTFYASAIRRGLHGSSWQKSVVNTLDDEIYVTFDVDYFDPAIMPSTGTPEPDGFLYHETLEVFREIKRQGKRIIGLDIVELSPSKSLHHSDITTARLIYKILNIAFDK